MKEKIKEIRTKVLLTQEEFAKEIGVAFATVQSWENRNVEPSFKCKRKIKEFCEKHNIEY
ncbi:MAG: XRE family transcriptional regulator [Spirochaetia bacterium]|nr:XRE family transcriptional regulator [Spirochaetia bacterium]